MHFDTFYQYFLFSKNWAYISIILILPVFALYWNTCIYPTKDKEVLNIVAWFKSKLPCKCKCGNTGCDDSK